MNANDLVRHVEKLVARDGFAIVHSDALKASFDDEGLDRGAPAGIPIRDAELEESRKLRPRIIRWKLGPHRTSYVGYSLVGDEERANVQAEKEGWIHQPPLR